MPSTEVDQVPTDVLQLAVLVHVHTKIHVESLNYATVLVWILSCQLRTELRSHGFPFYLQKVVDGSSS